MHVYCCKWFLSLVLNLYAFLAFFNKNVFHYVLDKKNGLEAVNDILINLG